MGRLEGKVALVTGAGQGIGLGIARRFAREGADVLIAEISEEHGLRAASELEALGGRSVFIRTDVTVKSDVEAAVARALEQWSRLDVLVNNAISLSPNVLVEQKTDDMLDHVLRSGLWATWWSCQSAFPSMCAQGGGRIVNFYSIDADAGAWLHADYNLTKAAIAGLTRSLASEWARFNILVNAIAPAGRGATFENLAKEIPGFEETAKNLNPLGRIGDPEEDIAPVVVFLASDDARYVTGATIPVDGGQHLPRYESKPQDLSAFVREPP